MKQKHTPGPWEIGYFVKSDVFADGGNKWVASLVSNDLDGTDEDAANAKLVAAAPDLLIVLQECYWQLSEAEHPKLLQRIEAAINKAT